MVKEALVIHDENFSEGRDLSRIRVVVLENETRLKVVQHGQYGMWAIGMEHGRIPQSLVGNYTTFVKAKEKIEEYAKLNGTKIKEVMM